MLANKREEQEWYKDKRSHRNESKIKRRETIALKSVATDQQPRAKKGNSNSMWDHKIHTNVQRPMSTCAAYPETQIESVSQIELNMSAECGEFSSTYVNFVNMVNEWKWHKYKVYTGVNIWLNCSYCGKSWWPMLTRNFNFNGLQFSWYFHKYK